METKNPRCAGIDVHKDSLKVAARVNGAVSIETFGTTTAEIFRLADWLASLGVTIAAMESSFSKSLIRYGYGTIGVFNCG